DRDQENAASAEAAARYDRTQLVLAAAEKFLEIGRRRPGRLGTRAPGSLRPRAPWPAALIIPGHEHVLLERRRDGRFPARSIPAGNRSRPLPFQAAVAPPTATAAPIRA